MMLMFDLAHALDAALQMVGGKVWKMPCQNHCTSKDGSGGEALLPN